MQTVSPGRGRVVRERACVLYHHRDGSIRDIQHVVVMEGGHGPSEAEIETMCRQALVKRGRPVDDLHTLHLDRSALKPFTVYRVDPRRKVLVEEPRRP